MTTKEDESQYGPGFAEAVDAALARYKKSFAEWSAEQQALLNDPRFYQHPDHGLILREGQSMRVSMADGKVLPLDAYTVLTDEP
jgi:hypothetical protein